MNSSAPKSAKRASQRESLGTGRPSALHHVLLLILGILTAAAMAGCGDSAPTEPAAPRASAVSVAPDAQPAANPGLDPRDERIAALAAWFQEQGVTLECTSVSDGYTEWRVAQPEIVGEYDVVFSIRSFPESATHEQMRAALDVNLRYELNAPARLAMSLGGFRAKHSAAELPQSDDELPRLHEAPITTAVERLFQQYAPR